MSNWRIPLSHIDFDEAEAAAVQCVLASKWVTMGPEVKAFETEFAQALGAKHALAVTNGTAGLHMAFLALGLKEGDEVVQPALNFVASANMTLAVGATPVFADIISIEEPTIDPKDVERLITSKTKALVALHYGGYSCRMDELLEICRRHSLTLVEDACHAVGAECAFGNDSSQKGMAGAVGDIGVFSFFGNKNIAIGEGGMIVTPHDELAVKLPQLRSHGMTSLTWDRHKGHAFSYDVVAHGLNYRLDEIRAAIGRVQLAKLFRNNALRRERLGWYRELLQPDNAWMMPFKDRIDKSSGHLMVALAESSEHRMKAITRLREATIQSSIHYPNILEFTAFAKWAKAELPKTREFCGRVLTLPLFPQLEKSEVSMVCSVLTGNV